MGIRDAPALGCSIDVHDAQVRVGRVIKTGMLKHPFYGEVHGPR